MALIAPKLIDPNIEPLPQPEPLPLPDPQPQLSFTFSPASGPVGTMVTLSGSAIQAGIAQVMFFNNVPASRQPDGRGNLIAVVPFGALPGPISLVLADGTVVSSSTNFQVQAGLANPTITSFFPTAGNPGVPVQINGSGFTGATGVRFGGVPATQFTQQADTNIIAIVPQNAVDGPITVERGTVLAQSAQSFDVTTTTLSITSVSPLVGPAGTQVTIIGNGFLGADTVMFGTASANFFIPNNGTIIAFAPTQLFASSVAITVRKGSASATFGQNFNYLINGGGGIGDALINSIAPSSGPAGTSVTIFGTGFTGTSNVQFGNLNVPFTILNDGQINAVAAGSPGTTVPVRVLKNGIVSQSPVGFTISASGGGGGGTGTGLPTISGFSPSTVFAGGMVRVFGTNFQGTTSVRIGQVVTEFQVVSNTEIRLIAPDFAFSGRVIVTNGAGTASSANFLVVR